jgi:hypothetical protein
VLPEDEPVAPATHLLLVPQTGVLPVQTLTLLQTPLSQSGGEQPSKAPHWSSRVHATQPDGVHVTWLAQAGLPLQVHAPFEHSSALPPHWSSLVQVEHPSEPQTSPPPHADSPWQRHCPPTQPSASEPQSESAQQ